MSSRVPQCRDTRRQLQFGRDDSLTAEYGEIEWLLASEGHYRKVNGSWSGGGPFYTIKQTRDLTKGASLKWESAGVTWEGSTGPPIGTVALPADPRTVVSSNPSYGAKSVSLAPYYAKGWAKTRPGNPVANLGQFLIELRDFPTIPGQAFHGIGWKGIGRSIRQRKLYRGLPFRDIPKVARDRVAWYSKLGSEYLNGVFGWKPFVKDLMDVYRLMKTIDKEMAQIKRDNGKSVRRSGTVSDDHSSSTTTSSFKQAGVYLSAFPPAWVSGWSTYSKTVTTSTRRWYVASYQYYIPDTDSWQWNARARAALFGVLPTPSLLYEVLPWSWMIDWFTNVGDVVSNLSANAVDNLVARYSYVMEHKTTTTTCSVNTGWGSKHVVSPYGSTHIDSDTINIIARSKLETKARAGGSPFGMGVTFDGLSARQGAILAALGLSRF